ISESAPSDRAVRAALPTPPPSGPCPATKPLRPSRRYISSSSDRPAPPGEQGWTCGRWSANGGGRYSVADDEARVLGANDCFRTRQLSPHPSERVRNQPPPANPAFSNPRSRAHPPLRTPHSPLTAATTPQPPAPPSR